MRPVFLILALTISVIARSQQGVAINTTGTVAHTSAMLDVSATDKGLLIPRVTSVQMTAIATPATGLMVFNTTSNTYYYYNGASWVQTGVTTVSSGNLSPLFTSTVTNAGSTPSISFSLATAPAYTVLTNPNNTTSLPSYTKVNPNALFATSGQTSNGWFYRGDGVWDNTVTIQGNTFNGANQLVKLDATGQLPALSGANLTNLNASNLASGQVPAARMAAGTANNTTFLRGDSTWAAVPVPAPIPSSAIVLSETNPNTNLTNAGYTYLSQLTTNVKNVTAYANTWYDLNASTSPANLTFPNAYSYVFMGDYIFIGPQITSSGKLYRYSLSNHTWDSTTISSGFGRTLLTDGSKIYSYSTVYQTGFQYDPATNTVTAIPSNLSLASRSFETELIAGNKLIYWGGGLGASRFNDGAIYDIGTNTWAAIANSPLLVGRVQHSSVWTGTEMIIFGGRDAANATLHDGAKYNPSTNTWTAIASNATLSSTQSNYAYWIGTEMVVFGTNPSKYNLGSNTWTSITSTLGGIIDTKPIGWAGTVFYFYDNSLSVVKTYNPSTGIITSLPNANTPPALTTFPGTIWCGDRLFVIQNVTPNSYNFYFPATVLGAFDTRTIDYYLFQKN